MNLSHVLTLSALFLPQDPAVQDHASRVAWLAEAGHALRTLDLAAEDDADLAPIVAAIGDRRIVCLGEAGHGDGAAFSAKARLARCLHERAGFDVIVFEAGFYECDRAWRLALEGESLVEAALGALQEIWGRSRAVREMLEWMQVELDGERPLRLAGMDLMPTGAHFSAVAEELRGAALEAGVDEPLVASGLAILGDLRGGVGRFMAAGQEEREEALGDIATLRERLLEVSDDPGGRASFFAQVLEGWERFLRMLLTGDMQKPEGGPGLNARDLQMATNLAWLLASDPDLKLIVWGATSHLSRRRDLLEVRTAADMVPCGEHLRRMGVDAYLLGVTAAGGEYGNALVGTTPSALPPAPTGSLEALWAETGCEQAFLDFRGDAPLPDWLTEEVTVRAMGHADVRGGWTRALDGLVFVRTMTPARRVD